MSDISSRSQMFFKIGVLKNFADFKGKHLCWILFLIIRLATLFKKRLKHRCFPVKLAKFLRTPFFCRTPPVAASGVKRKMVQSWNEWKKRQKLLYELPSFFRGMRMIYQAGDILSVQTLFCWMFLTGTRIFYIRKRFIRNSNQIGLLTQETNLVSFIF